MLNPVAMSIITNTFTEPAERARDRSDCISGRCVGWTVHYPSTIARATAIGGFNGDLDTIDAIRQN
jgi:hypothetical protein